MSTRKSTLLAKLKKTYCRIRLSQVEGIGVVAIRDIPAGINPFSGISPQRWYKVPVSQLRDFDAEIYKMIDDFFVIESDGTAWVPEHGLNGMDISFFLNHSTTPNVSRYEDSGNYFTLRPIAKGEELLVSYATFDHKYRLE